MLLTLPFQQLQFSLGMLYVTFLRAVESVESVSKNKHQYWIDHWAFDSLHPWSKPMVGRAGHHHLRKQAWSHGTAPCCPKERRILGLSPTPGSNPTPIFQASKEILKRGLFMTLNPDAPKATKIKGKRPKVKIFKHLYTTHKKIYTVPLLYSTDNLGPIYGHPWWRLHWRGESWPCIGTRWLSPSTNLTGYVHAGGGGNAKRI